MTDPHPEQGSATILNVAMIAGALLIAMGLLGASQQIGIKSYASGVADIAALATATSKDCQRAHDVVTRHTKHRLRLTKCTIEDGFAQVQVLTGGRKETTVTSRAGPSW